MTPRAGRYRLSVIPIAVVLCRVYNIETGPRCSPVLTKKNCENQKNWSFFSIKFKIQILEKKPKN
jgi:hypothetical protein